MLVWSVFHVLNRSSDHTTQHARRTHERTSKIMTLVWTKPAFVFALVTGCGALLIVRVFAAETRVGIRQPPDPA
jgi:hypothetical protein